MRTEPDDPLFLHEAMLFTISVHGTQTRKYTREPYWPHCAAVAAITASVTDDKRTIAAAWMHDVLEDTDTTFGEIEDVFGVVTANLVLQVTDVSTPADGPRATRKALDREHLAQACGRAQTIKLADLIHNTTSIVTQDPGFAKVYLQEKRLLLQVLTKGSKDLELYAWRQLHVAERQLGLL